MGGWIDGWISGLMDELRCDQSWVINIQYSAWLSSMHWGQLATETLTQVLRPTYIGG